MDEISSAFSRFLRAVPVVGYAMRCLSEHRYNELSLLGANLLMAAAVGLLAFGYPLLITAVLFAAAFVGIIILSATVD